MDDTKEERIINISGLIDEIKCYEKVRQLRWHEETYCAWCNSNNIVRNGHKKEHPGCQKYYCQDCKRYFDDLTNTIFSGHHQPLSVWILCLYFMGLNVSNIQIATELDLCESDVQNMTTKLREGIATKRPEVVLEGKVEFDEVYIVAGHKGHPEAVKKKGRKGRRNRLKGARGRGTLEKEKPPIFGMIQRGGQLVINMLENVQQVTIAPIIKAIVKIGTLIFTDEYSIYDRLKQWGFSHKTVNHSNGEFARDEDGDGFCEVHVNTIEGAWSLLRSWLRPHRGISQERLPLYLAFFEFVYNSKIRGKGLLDSLIGVLVT